MLTVVVSHKWKYLAETNDPPQEWNFNSGSEQVWYGDDMIYENYLGKKNIEYDSNFTRSTKFRICSNSKLMTAVAILQLVDDGKIGSIYDSISDYLDSNDLQLWGFPANTTTFCPTVYNTTECQNITFVSLMSMSSGVIAAITCDYAPDQWQYQYCIPPSKQTVYPGSIADSISYFIQNPLNWPPGPAYNATYNTYWYANENFIILSYFVEKYGNMSLASYFSRRIYQPLGMNDTVYDPWNQAFYLHSEQSSEYLFYTDYAGNNNNLSTQPFAYGSCASIEVNPGFQAGSGGVVSTLPDMAKWYASLFIATNTSVVLSADSLSLLLFPWALESLEPVQYYGLGTEMMFAQVYESLPPLPSPTSAPLPPPIYTYYMGGSVCTFFSVVVVNSTENFFTGEPLITLPMLSLVARNNRIMNVTEQVYQEAMASSTGTWFSLTGWPTGWGAANADLTDTFLEALNLGMYYAALPYTPTSPAPTAAPTGVAGGGGDNGGLDDEELAWVLSVVGLVGVLTVAVGYFFAYWQPKVLAAGGVGQQQMGQMSGNPML
eukprot:gene33494-40525_t